MASKRDNPPNLNRYLIVKTYITILSTALLVLVAADARGQAGPPLGDDFIFFVNGTNTVVPRFDGTVVDDPTDATNKVVQYNYGNWSFQAFRFADTVGVDMSQNRMDGDVLHVRLLVDPANQGQPNVALMMEDKTDFSGANDGSADLPFRLVWRVPEHYRDGSWHTLDIPLPPPTWQELEDAKAADTLDSLATYWVYAGAWSSGGFGVGVSDEMGPHTADNPDLWEEFEWSNVQNVGFFWDNNTGGGSVWVDDVYIGRKDLDLSVANDPAGAMTGVTFEATAEGNRVSWTHSPDFGGYNVYASPEAFTDVSASGVSLIEAVPSTASMFEVLHAVEVIHPSLAPVTLHYAVTSLSQFGVENPDISMSSASLANPDLPIQAFITELTEPEGEALFDALAAGDISGEGFPDWLQPFTVDMSHSKLGDAATGPDSDEDLSAKVWAGYTGANELFIYAEVTDDVITLAGEGVPPSDAWQNDSIEFGWGNYDVRDVEGGSLVGGSPHQDIERGAFADYQFRISGHGDGTKAGTTPYAFVGWSIDAVPPGGGAAYDVIEEGGATTGWKVLALLPLNAIQNVDMQDAVLDPPTGTDIRFIPFNIAVNDGDGANRDTQIQWSVKGNAGAQWWNTPAQWMTVAMAGRQTAVSSETEAELPDAITLAQNYPNPFNPSTSIRFTLPEAQRVTLRVFDVLGRQVASLLSDKSLGAGTHTVRFDAGGLASGVYLYRLESGSSVFRSRRMLLTK